MNKKCVVTGGEGFIGSYICKALVLGGNEVESVDYRPKIEERISGVKYNEFDIRDTERLKTVFDGADIVFHIAGLPRASDSFDDPEETLGVNVLGTKSVLDAAVSSGVRRVVFASSSAIYGEQKTLPLVEEMFPLPLSPYGFQKYLGEKLMLEYARKGLLETVSLRFFNVYGYWSDLSSTGSLAITRFLKYRSSGKPLTVYGDGKQTRDFVHVNDVALACIKASQSNRVGRGEIINIASGEPIDVITIAKSIGGQIEFMNAPVKEIHDSFANIELSKKILDWSPSIRFDEGVAELKKQWNIN